MTDLTPIARSAWTDPDRDDGRDRHPAGDVRRDHVRVAARTRSSSTTCSRPATRRSAPRARRSTRSAATCSSPTSRRTAPWSIATRRCSWASTRSRASCSSPRSTTSGLPRQPRVRPGRGHHLGRGGARRRSARATCCTTASRPRIDQYPDEQGKIWPLAYNVRTLPAALPRPGERGVEDHGGTAARSDTPYRLPRAVEIGLVLIAPDPEDRPARRRSTCRSSSRSCSSTPSGCRTRTIRCASAVAEPAAATAARARRGSAADSLGGRPRSAMSAAGAAGGASPGRARRGRRADASPTSAAGGWSGVETCVRWLVHELSPPARPGPAPVLPGRPALEGRRGAADGDHRDPDADGARHRDRPRRRGAGPARRPAPRRREGRGPRLQRGRVPPADPIASKAIGRNEMFAMIAPMFGSQRPGALAGAPVRRHPDDAAPVRLRQLGRRGGAGQTAKQEGLTEEQVDESREPASTMKRNFLDFDGDFRSEVQRRGALDQRRQPPGHEPRRPPRHARPRRS